MDNSFFLRRVFKLDAATCFACFALLTFAATPLAPLLGLDAGFLRGAGIVLLPCAIFFFWLGSRIPPLALAIVGIAGNFLWVAESILVIVMQQGAITTLGIAFVAAQAAGVLLLALLESYGVKVMRGRAAAA